VVKDTGRRVTPGDGAFPPPLVGSAMPTTSSSEVATQAAWRRDPGWQDVPTCGSHTRASPAAGGQSSSVLTPGEKIARRLSGLESLSPLLDSPRFE